MDKGASPPFSCNQLLGQERAKKLLSYALAKNRVPHGFLFAGPFGVGKSLFAKGVAVAMNCEQKSASTPLSACCCCASCKKISHGNHPDFQVISPQNGVLKIARIRQLIKEMEYPPYEASMRVVVLEDAHTMGREAANALLKTLEEPQPGNLLILTADSSQKLLDTITSRCQVIPFLPLSFADTAAILAAHDIPQEEASLLARLADGSPGAALQLQKAEIVSLWREIITFLMQSQSVDQTVNAENIFSLLAFAEQMAALKESLPALLRLFRRWLRDMLLEDAPSLACYCGDFAKDAVKQWNREELSAKLRALEQAEKELARNCQRTLVCEVLLFALQARIQ